MIIVLLGVFVPFPGAAAEPALPIIGRSAIWRGIRPNVPIAFGAGSRRPTFGEPGMFVGGMVRNEINYDLDILAVQALDDPVEIFKAAESRVDSAVIGDVVTKIQHRRGIKWSKPHGIDTKPRQVIDPAFQASQVPFAIAIGVLKGDRSDLVDYRAFPPFRLFLQSHASVLRPGMKTAYRWKWFPLAPAGRTARLLTYQSRRRRVWCAAELHGLQRFYVGWVSKDVSDSTAAHTSCDEGLRSIRARDPARPSDRHDHCVERGRSGCVSS